ncbi:hypothetical protein CERSUDRAFT_163665 [Gelatoporia subvermispora B]|uniref:Uncharacterized protein n=1 Tax=Ceriporiopsis subvermispora (strain B) TaxID=914234 RepID=M2QY83_CERS8|nr:hypothetical protein CERSUDRAFT_163665 [Gelatoporia subvermispora B]
MPDNAHPHVLSYLSLSVSHPLHLEVARLSAVQINRAHYHGGFLEVIGGVSQELKDFSEALFDKHGRLKYDLINHEYLKGSGVWGREMDNGLLLYIESVMVEASFRNAGLASWMLNKLIQSEHVALSGFMICLPAPIIEPTNEVNFTAQVELVVNFFRKNGYRRIGRTSFFAYTPNTTHPSHNLTASEDPDRRQIESQDLHSVPTQARAARYVVHSIIVASSTQSVSLMDVVSRPYERDPTSVRQRDSSGLSPLHLAALAHSLGAVNALLSLPPEAGVYDDLSSRDNADCDTPLETCEREMRNLRGCRESSKQAWYGYPDDALRVILALRRAAGEEIEESDEEYIKKRKWGCTCGQCIVGWLSLRMKYRLHATAKGLYNIMGIRTPTFINHHSLAPGLYHCCPTLEFIPSHIRPSLYKSFYQAYRLVFIAASRVLEKHGEFCLPTTRAVLETMLLGEVQNYANHWSRGRGEFFFKKGGKVEYALDCVMHAAIDQSPLGNGEFDRLRERDEEWNALPRCVNDLEFEMVRQQIGLDPSQKWGPYVLGEDAES